MRSIAPSARIGEELTGVVLRGVAAAAGQADRRGMLIRLGMQRVLQELLEGE